LLLSKRIEQIVDKAESHFPINVVRVNIAAIFGDKLE
jgi:hypothetical protein